jgi:hypothetical protein
MRTGRPFLLLDTTFKYFSCMKRWYSLVKRLCLCVACVAGLLLGATLSIRQDSRPLTDSAFARPEHRRRLRVFSRPASTDPKTVSEKYDRHNLRYLVFGSSISWGAAIDDRSKAFPYLLSPNVTNLALRANGPNYPSVCTETMVGEDSVYDVIILEYFLRAYEGLLRLAVRLRQRFPNASIVILRIWSPLLYTHVPTGLSMREWMQKNDFGDNLIDAKFHAMLRMTKREDWIMSQTVDAIGYQEEAAKAVNGIIWSLPHLDDARTAVIKGSPLFTDDWHHLSEIGHEYVKEAITHVMRRAHATRSDELGLWGDGGDYCESWFSSGKCSLTHSTNMELKIWATNGPKWGMLVPWESGWIQVNNPFPELRRLHISYMVSGPPPSIYPRMRVVFVDRPIEPVEIDPTSYVQDGHRVHVVSTTPVAMIPPGVTRLLLQPLEGETSDRQRFRLTGIAITSEQVTLMQVRPNTFLDFSSVLPDSREASAQHK